MSIEQMQDYYDKRAGHYDASMGYENPVTVGTLAPVIEYLKAQVIDKNVLELACGPGFWTSHLIETVKFVCATDFNNSRLDQALS